MGRKKIPPQQTEDIFRLVSTMFVPENILENFDIYGAEKRHSNWVIELREKSDRIPKS